MKFQRTKSNAFLRSTFSIQQGVFITINNVCGKEKILCCEDLPNIALRNSFEIILYVVLRQDMDWKFLFS